MRVMILVAAMAAFAGCSSQVKYCYVEAGFWGGLFRLRGHTNGLLDRDYGVFSSVTDAVSAATEIGCEVRP